MQICPKCFDDMRMVNVPKLHFVCDDCGYKDEAWEAVDNRPMTLIKTLSNGKVLIAVYKLVNGLYHAYIVRAGSTNELVLSAWCPNWLEETLMNRYDNLKVQ